MYIFFLSRGNSQHKKNVSTWSIEKIPSVLRLEFLFDYFQKNYFQYFLNKISNKNKFRAEQTTLTVSHYNFFWFSKIWFNTQARQFEIILVEVIN